MGRADTSELFNTIARRYDLITAVMSLGLHQSWRHRMIRLLPQNADLQILDLGTGTGDIALNIAKSRGSTDQIIGIDSAAQMLSVARRKADISGLNDRVSFYQASAEEIPFASGTFDVLTLAFGIRNMPQRSRVFKEIHRVLKPDGKLILLELSRPDSLIFRFLFQLYLLIMLRLVGTCVFGYGEEFRYFYHSIKKFPKKKTLQAELRKHSFVDVSVVPVCFGVAAIYVAQKGGE